MLESGSIVELSNNKKYIITDSSIENGDIYYLGLELDYNTEMPMDESVFFKQNDEHSLLKIKNENDIEFLKDVFVNKFLSTYLEDEQN